MDQDALIRKAYKAGKDDAMDALLYEAPWHIRFLIVWMILVTAIPWARQAMKDAERKGA